MTIVFDLADIHIYWLYPIQINYVNPLTAPPAPLTEILFATEGNIVGGLSFQKIVHNRRQYEWTMNSVLVDARLAQTPQRGLFLEKCGHQTYIGPSYIHIGPSYIHTSQLKS